MEYRLHKSKDFFSESLSSYCKKGILTVNFYCLFMYSNLNKILITLNQMHMDVSFRILIRSILGGQAKL